MRVGARGGSTGGHEPLRDQGAVAGWATDGRYALVEAGVDAGTTVPSHVTQREHVVVHVLDGELDVVVDRTAMAWPTDRA